MRLIPLCAVLILHERSGPRSVSDFLKYMDSGSPIEGVDQSEASSPPCWGVQLLSRRLLGNRICVESCVFLVGIHLSCCLVLQLPRLPKRGTLKWVYLSQGSVLLSFI